MARAFESGPASAMIAFMMAFFSADFATISTISFSAASDTPMKCDASFTPVPFAWMIVPPPAPLERAASITRSVYPWFVIVTRSSYFVSFKTDSSPFINSCPQLSAASARLPPTLENGMMKATPVPGTSMRMRFCSP